MGAPDRKATWVRVRQSASITLALSALLTALPAASATLATPDLADMTLEQLGTVIVTSVSRDTRPRASQSAGADQQCAAPARSRR